MTKTDEAIEKAIRKVKRGGGPVLVLPHHRALTTQRLVKYAEGYKELRFTLHPAADRRKTLGLLVQKR